MRMSMVVTFFFTALAVPVAMVMEQYKSNDVRHQSGTAYTEDEYGM